MIKVETKHTTTEDHVVEDRGTIEFGATNCAISIDYENDAGNENDIATQIQVHDKNIHEKQLQLKKKEKHGKTWKRHM